MKFNFIVKLFLLIIPFLYYLQVQLWRKDFVPIPYLVLLFSILLTYYNRQKKCDIPGKKSIILLDELVHLFLFINFTWVFFELATVGFIGALRIFIYFVIPLFLYYYVSRYMEEKDINHILLILLLTSTVVAGEDLYERYYNIVLLKSCAFQERNFNYVATLGSGTELSHLKNYLYRAPGILEHLHATGTYIGLGLLSALYFFLSKKNRIYLILLIFNFTALIVSGARIALIATLISALVFMYLQKRYLKRKEMKAKRFILALFVLICLLIFLIFYYGPIHNTYKPLFTGGPEGIAKFIKIALLGINSYINKVNEQPIMLLIGYGAGTTLRVQMGAANADIFIIDLLYRYGVLGSFIFYFTFFIFAKEVLFSIKKKFSFFKCEDKGILILSFSIILLLFITTIHSGALVRKSIFPWVFVAYGIGRRYILGIYNSTIR